MTEFSASKSPEENVNDYVQAEAVPSIGNALVKEPLFVLFSM
jgi:hypothetical protein